MPIESALDRWLREGAARLGHDRELSDALERLAAHRDSRDCLVLLGERFLRIVVAQYVEHYHRERHHQGLDGRLIDPEPVASSGDGPIECRERLGGLLRYYYRRAA